MEFESKKGRTIRKEEDEDCEGEDRISSLPDDLIHHILSFIDAKFAVHAGILSNRWKHIWKTLPHINLHCSNFNSSARFSKFAADFLSHRNHRSEISTINYYQYGVLSPAYVKRMMKYAISHNIKQFCISAGATHQSKFPLFLFDSPCLEKLWVDMRLNLTNSLSCGSWVLPALTDLRLSGCDLPQFSWGLPSLRSLHLDRIRFSKEKTVSFSDFVSLRSLVLSDFIMNLDLEVFDISSAQLENLIISNSDPHWAVDIQTCKLVVTAPKLSSFEFECFTPILLSAHGLNCLDKVYIDCNDQIKYYHHYRKRNDPKLMGQQLINMFKQLCNTKCLTLTSYTIKILSNVSDLLENQLSPFSNLKKLKLKVQQESSFSTLPSHVRNYLLGSSPKAIIVTESAMINVDHKTVAVSSVAQNAGFSNPLSTPIDALRVVGNVVANVNAMDAAVARQESSGSNCMNFPTAEARVGDKGLLQPADNVPFVHPNVEEGTGVRNKEVAMNLLCCTGKKGSKVSLVEPMEINLGDKNTLQNGESPMLCEVGDAGEEVEEHEEVHSDAEQVRAQHGHVEAGLNEDNIVKDTREERIEEEQVEQLKDQVNAAVSNIREIGVDLEAVNGVEAHALVAGGVRSSRKNDSFKLWQGHAVYPECVDLLELIRKTYPETFKGFAPQSEMIYTLGLFTLYTAVKSFSDVSTVEVTAATITKYRGLFTDLERWGFNINWVVNHLNCIEQLRFSRPLVDELHVIDRRLEEAQRQVRELQSLRSAKAGEIQEAFGHLGTHLAAGCLGDGLFPDH